METKKINMKVLFRIVLLFLLFAAFLVFYVTVDNEPIHDSQKDTAKLFTGLAVVCFAYVGYNEILKIAKAEDKHT